MKTNCEICMAELDDSDVKMCPDCGMDGMCSSCNDNHFCDPDYEDEDE